MSTNVPATPVSGAESSECPLPQRWVILAFMCLALVVTGLDTLIVSVAIPSIDAQLRATPGQLQWIIAAYSLAFAAPLPFAGGLADRFGRRLSFLLGMVVMLIGSVLAATSESADMLIGSRVIMGLGAAFIMPSTLALIREIFPESERAKALGIWVGMSSLGIPLGPILGGLLLQSFPWGSVFLINVPLILVAFIACLLLVPESRSTEDAKLDYVGLLLSVLGPALLVYGIISAPKVGWGAFSTLLSVIGGILLIGAFILWERKAPSPMLSHAVFRDRRFGAPLLTIATVFFGVFGGLFLVTQHLQFTLELDPLTAGLHMLAMCSAVLVAPIAPRLVVKFGLARVSTVAPVMIALGMILLATEPSPSSVRVILALFALGLGVGFGAPISVNSIIEATPRHLSGAGSAVADVAMQLGGALGIALLGSIGVATASVLSPTGIAAASCAGAIVAAIGAIAIFVVLPKRASDQQPAEPASTPV
ncbi:MFS transporter [Microbacterium sp. BWT-B31]|uniref:MFS transporter n=1 Tax=Microbacterium sp. BWT-B31 TaxID=3232072 RepID=UPI003528180A